MEVAGRVVVNVGQSAAAKVLVDGDAPAVKGGKGVADELRWSKAELLVSLGGAEQHWGGGSTESRSSPEMMGKGRRCESPESSPVRAIYRSGGGGRA